MSSAAIEYEEWSPISAAVQVGPSIVIAIAANKQDLRKKQVVSSGESEAYAKSIKALHFGTSAKTGDGLPDIFQAIATTVVARLPTSGAAVGPPLKHEQHLQPVICCTA